MSMLYKISVLAMDIMPLATNLGGGGGVRES